MHVHKQIANSGVDLHESTSQLDNGLWMPYLAGEIQGMYRTMI